RPLLTSISCSLPSNSIYLILAIALLRRLINSVILWFKYIKKAPKQEFSNFGAFRGPVEPQNA
ncbi:hypothetical protein OBA27_03445, partial [Pelagibacteraceae bacterium]|nr:hypothetical protein [Pelagibacteraceae bacterium]